MASKANFKKFNAKQVHEFMKGNLNSICRKICGEKLGSGCYRDVFVLKQNADYVVKVERDMASGNFANAMEWRNYINNKEWDLIGPWMAPCEIITIEGQILIQRRVYTEGKRRKDYPVYIPVLFTDTKLENFGWTSDGHFVCCDYSSLITPTPKQEMKYAKWKGSLKLNN